MTDNTNTTRTALVYNGAIISDRQEMLSLTDMWKAAGSDPQKAPAQWQRLPQAIEFIDHVADIVGKSHNNLILGLKRKGTYAHWQIALAYAKYLSPEFHMWCNTVVRERMEGQAAAPVLAPDVLEMIRRDEGISRMLAHKVTGMEGKVLGIEAAVQVLMNTVAAIASVVQPPGAGVYVHGVTAGEVWDRFGLPRIKNGSLWLGNKLSEMGCQMEACRTARLGNRTARMYDPDKASACMRNGLLHKAKVHVSERLGQRRLNLIGGGKS